MKTNVQKAKDLSSRRPHITMGYSVSVKSQFSLTDAEKNPFIHWSPHRADCLHLPGTAGVSYQTFTKTL